MGQEGLFLLALSCAALGEDDVDQANLFLLLPQLCVDSFIFAPTVC